MRRYTVTVGDQAYVIDVEERSADTFTVILDGRPLSVRVDGHEDLAQAAIRPQLEIADSPGAAGVPTAAGAASAAGHGTAAARLTGATTPHTPPPSRAPRAAAGTDATTLTAPMPGVILTIVAPVGTVVAQGDPLLVLEAMKMKNTLRAGRDGRVAEVAVGVGDQVKFGDVLVRVEDA